MMTGIGPEMEFLTLCRVIKKANLLTKGDLQNLNAIRTWFSKWLKEQEPSETIRNRVATALLDIKSIQEPVAFRYNKWRVEDERIAYLWQDVLAEMDDFISDCMEYLIRNYPKYLKDEFFLQEFNARFRSYTDVHQWYTKRIAERIEPEQHTAEELPEDGYPTFPANTLIEIMLPNTQSRFLEIEKKMIEAHYFDKRGKWAKTRIELAAFLFILKVDKNLTKPNIKGYTKLREFFNKRYSIVIPPDYTKPSKMTIKGNPWIREILLKLNT
jgi:hypothetical protein